MRTPNSFNESALAYSILKSTGKSAACVAQIASELDNDITASYGRVRYMVKSMVGQELLMRLGNKIAEDGRLVFYAQTDKGKGVFNNHTKMMRRLLKKRIPR